MDVTLPSTATRRSRRSRVDGNTLAWICAERFSRVISITRKAAVGNPRGPKEQAHGVKPSALQGGGANALVGGSCGAEQIRAENNAVNAEKTLALHSDFSGQFSVAVLPASKRAGGDAKLLGDIARAELIRPSVGP